MSIHKEAYHDHIRKSDLTQTQKDNLLKILESIYIEGMTIKEVKELLQLDLAAGFKRNFRPLKSWEYDIIKRIIKKLDDPDKAAKYINTWMTKN